MTRLATTITIPVASAAKQENSTRSLRRKGMLNASPSPPLCTAHFDTPRFGLTFDARLRSHQELLRLLPALGRWPDRSSMPCVVTHDRLGFRHSRPGTVCPARLKKNWRSRFHRGSSRDTRPNAPYGE